MEILSSIYDWLTLVLKAADLLPDFSSPRGIFCAIAWLATAISLVMLVLSIFSDFGGDDLEVTDGDTGSLSVRALVGFALGLGWGGFIAIQSGAGVMLSIVVGLMLGVIMFFIVAGIMRVIYSLKADGSLNYSSLVGMTGTVYVTIPPRGEPGGQVQVAHPSQMITMPAVQEGDTPLPAMTRIEVVAATTYQLVVRPISSTSTSK
ncbi:MAG: hypothetical protein II349_00650 [Akkermansia sp.]|nr:hypothetical protein [Akkermansia sp.]